MASIESLLREREEIQQQQASQQAMIETQNDTIEKLRAYILQLEEYVRNGRRKQFGPSSEKLADLQPNLFNEAEAEATGEEPAEETPAVAPAEAEAPARERKVRKAFRIPPELPRLEIIHDLPESEKVCPHDGTPLKRIDSEVHEQLDIIPAQVQVLRHIRHTYACPCCEHYVVTAAKPKQPIEKGLASPRLLATVATQKYVGGSISRSRRRLGTTRERGDRWRAAALPPGRDLQTHGPGTGPHHPGELDDEGRRAGPADDQPDP